MTISQNLSPKVMVVKFMIIYLRATNRTSISIRSSGGLPIVSITTKAPRVAPIMTEYQLLF